MPTQIDGFFLPFHIPSRFIGLFQEFHPEIQNNRDLAKMKNPFEPPSLPGKYRSNSLLARWTKEKEKKQPAYAFNSPLQPNPHIHPR
ncbi:hypothetical protein TNCT_139301 [Trichonephila clavata]|uniref:Uncharacterized protein n=1 Tax=Trichonephila clavata TaxID=2740835 RepID=A0A8X6FAN8_TRICU|nr:hypothetical protein TNCT_139301 [Trichonephila clavata]